MAALTLLLLRVAARADTFDTVRLKWQAMITGGSTYDPTDPDISPRITSITNSANSSWNSMVKTGGTSRTYLWSDLTSTTDSAQISTLYGRLRAMALGYATHGSSLEGNLSLRADIIGGLDWMYAKRYNTTQPEYDNWWDWEIGGPLALNDTAVLVYPGLNSTQIANYCASIDHYVPVPDMTGANLVWECTVVSVRGMLGKSDAKISAARDALSPVFLYDHADGFHLDGSFIQHTAHPYAGGYGLTLLQYLPPLISVLQGSSWAITDPNQNNIYRWIYDSFAPLIYKGGFMSMTRGREISRSGSQEHNTGQKAMEYLLRWGDIAPANDALTYKRMIKYWMQQDTFRSFMTSIGNIGSLIDAIAVRDDATITPITEPVLNQPFPEMDRVVHLRPGFGFGLSMYSSRIYDYESINSENLRAWHTGSGMTYLYNGDLGHYDQDYWPTVNPYRLPGTTVDTQTLADGANQSKKSTQSWVGGAEILGLYGGAGMSLAAQGNTLTAKKSWFMFDDEIVALGSDITSTDNRTIETIVENRRLIGTNVLTVNGTAQPTTMPWSATLSAVNWMHLAGAAAGADIGYYFPTASTIKAVREARTSSWDAIGTGSATAITRNYVTFWRDHGANPTAATYAYVLLPNKTTTQVSAYAASPDVTILENSSTAQGVKENKLNLVAVNFWQDATKTVDILTSNKKASVIAKENAGQDIEISVADPTQLGSTINIEINRSASATIYQDSRITVTQLSPTIKFTVNVYAGTPGTDEGNGIRGHAWKAKFDLAPAKTPATGAAWENAPMLVQTGSFTAEFDAVPSTSPLNSVIGISNNSASAYTAVATAVRFNNTGTIDARNAGTYAAASSIPFTGGSRYHFRLVVDIPSHTYSAYVTPPGGSELTIGTTFGFRTEQNAVTQLNNWAAFADPSNPGSVQLSGFVLRNTHTTSVGVTFMNTPVESQGGTFNATFEATPSASPFNSVLGFSSGAAAAYTDGAAVVRFNTSGTIDARNGATYQALQGIPFSGGATYRFRLVVNVAAHTYSAYVTPPDGREITIGLNYAFRTEQNTVAALANFLSSVDAGVPGSLVVSRLTLADQALRLWLPLDDTGTVAFDESRSFASGTLQSGPVWTIGAHGNALDFDGVAAHVKIPSGMANFTSGMTIVVWANPATVKNYARFVELGSGPSANNILFGRNAATNDLMFQVYNGATSGTKVTAAGAIALNTWQHFAATIDGSGNVKLYKNGAQVATGTTSAPVNTTRTTNYLGRSSWTADSYYDGVLDDVRIYARVLSAAEILALP